MGMQEPFSNKDLLQELARLEWKEVYGHYADDHRLERTRPSKSRGQFYVRKKKKPEHMYITEEESFDHLKCVTCRTTIERVEVVHKIHTSLFNLPGTEKNSYENVPYCPACERKPNPEGTPIGKPARVVT